MEIATSLVREKGINVNSNLKKQGIRSDWGVIIKKILIDMSKDMIVTIVSKFGEIKSIKIQLIGMWQKAVVEFIELDQADLLYQFKAFLFTLSMGTMAHDLETFLERASKKTCVINRSVETGNKTHCIVVGFNSDDDLESAFYTKLILGSIKLSWTRIDLVQCKRCEKFGHSVLECNAPVASIFRLLKTFKRVLYEKKSVQISCPVVFGGKFWIQVVSLAGFSNGFHFTSGSGSPFFNTSSLNGGILLISVDNLSLDAYLVSLEQSLELLTDQVSGIVFSATLIAAKKNLALNMIVDGLELVLLPSFSVSSSVSALSQSSSKVLMTKIDSLESKLVAFEAFVGSVLAKLDYLYAGLGLLLSSSSQ
ncbi:hypothetical protein G9A89_007907 [Geosiphon pyriformis]|nr:hypothetical protein G9A89_007907 [Geosiphon pyriformis]